MKLIYALVIALLLLVSVLPSSMAATYIIEHDGELDLLERARSTRSATIVDPVVTSGDRRDPSLSYDNLRYHEYDDDDVDDVEHDDYDDYDNYFECIDDADDEYEDGRIDYDDYRDELRDCERLQEEGDGYHPGPLRSLAWFYEWKFYPKTFLDRYCPPHPHRYPAADGPTLYEITWVHDCTPRYGRAFPIVHYNFEDYAVDDPEVVMRPEYRRQDSTVRYTFIGYYTFTGYNRQSVPSKSLPMYPEDAKRHAEVKPGLKRVYSDAAYRPLRDYCERTRATDGSMNAWCQERKHLWS